MKRHVREIAGALLWLVAFLIVFALTTGCATARADRVVVYTEQGIEAVASAWDMIYYRRLAVCEAQHEPRTPGAESCFGAMYDADARVRLALESAVLALRAYWTARAAGEDPDWRRTALQVDALLRDLPPELQPYADRIRGVPDAWLRRRSQSQ